MRLRENAHARTPTALLLVLALTACNAPTANPAIGGPAPPPTSASNKLLQTAIGEGTLNLVSSGAVWNGTAGAKLLQDAFNAKYGTNVTVNFIPGPSMSEGAIRIAQEVQAGQQAFTDVLVVNAESLVDAYPAAAVMPLDQLPDLPPGAAVGDNRAVRIMSDFIGITYNTRMVAADQVPRTLQDLLDPKWKGKLATTSYATGFNYLPFVIGADQTRAYVRQFAQQVSGLTRCGEEERVAGGEFPIFALTCGKYVSAQLAAKGAPLAAQPLEDATMMLHWYLIIPTTSAHPALGTMFSAFLATKAGQDAYYKATYVSDLLVDGTPMNREYEEAKRKGTAILDLSLEWSQANRTQSAKYQQEFAGVLRGG